MVKVRMVVMTPVVVIEEFEGLPEAAGFWAGLYVHNRMYTPVDSHIHGEVDGFYQSKLMEVTIQKDPDDELEEIVAPGKPA